MENKIRVCCFCEIWESGGIESLLFNVITHMDCSSLEIDVVASTIKDSVFTERLKTVGVRFFELSGSQNALFANWRRFKKLIRERQYSVLHLNVFHGLSLYYAALAKAAGVPKIIAHSHNTALRSSVGLPVKLLVHNMAKHLWAECATNYWACSGAAANFLFPSKIAEQYKFIPNGIETERFRFSLEGRAAVRRELGIAENTLLIGNVGRLCYQKNQSFLLDVFSQVHRRNPHSCLILVGEGELRQKLEKKATDLDIAERVIFYGASEQIERLMWAMDVFVFPSRFEGLSLVTLEAQAAGLPLLCSMQPVEARLSESVHMHALTEGAEFWAKSILNIREDKPREQGFIIVKTAGFDISAVANTILTGYIS